MKKILLVFVLITILIPFTNAQSVGEKWIGGSIGFSANKNDGGDRVFDYNITPEFGYILTDKFALGIAVGYDHQEDYHGVFSNGVDHSYVAKLDGFTVNPFVRYTFLKGNIGGLFVDGGVKYGHYQYREEEVKSKKNELEVGFRPGVAVVLSPKLSLVGRFGFLGYKRRFTEGYYSDSFGFNFDMRDVSLGVNVVF